MKTSIFIILFFITIPIIFSYNLTTFLQLKPQNFVLVDAVVNIMEKTYIRHQAKGVSISTTTKNHKSLHKPDMVSKLFQNLGTEISYRFFYQEILFLNAPMFHNVIFLNDYNDFR